MGGLGNPDLDAPAIFIREEGGLDSNQPSNPLQPLALSPHFRTARGPGRMVGGR